MATNKPMQRLMSSFKGIGLSATQVRHFLPEWWDDDVALDDGGLLEVQILLARRLNVTLESLQSAAPQFRHTAPRFKTVHPEGSAQLAVAASVGRGLGQLLATACPVPFRSAELSATQVRSQLLKVKALVSLESLCDWMWRHGIPVIHITGWPKQLRRPDAMCMRVEDRPIVMVVRKEQAPPKLAYLVAHELGHVMLGHLTTDRNAVLVDDLLPVDNQATFFDDDEKAADEFAIELLGGDSLLHVANALVGPSYDDMQLAVAALRASKDKMLDAGQVILSWARKTEDWKLAALAMRYLMTTGPAPLVINDVATRHLDVDALSSEGKDHLSRLTEMTLDAT